MRHTLGGCKGGWTGDSGAARPCDIFPRPDGRRLYVVSLTIDFGRGGVSEGLWGEGCLLLRVTVITGRLQLCGRTHLHPSLRAAVAFKITFFVRHILHINNLSNTVLLFLFFNALTISCSCYFSKIGT